MVRFKDKSGKEFHPISERGWNMIKKSGKYIRISSEGDQTKPATKKNKDVRLQKEKENNDKTEKIENAKSL